ncbi:LysR family transcriptional regulator [Amycolatopsis thermophila]|uniref:Molybdate transport repressor ModE-like protein n=1 Tax=Amycolatopsis thermophila TaxID=206084 RepID=A0ABU0EQ36_9PSEU|nr:LysR family transcriptional regulator [Amycolatopsis thermophila]MDQ0377416.1 molybdate transport repressor ModE-like protein [Amycolatopsis thermophila]
MTLRVTDLAGFELLLSVAQLGSIGAAARAHGISQPAASARIRQLETQTGVILVNRSPRGSSLTESGALVADWARPVVEAAADLDAGIAALRARRDEHLRVAASLTVAEYLLPRWLAALRRLDPGTAVALTSGNSDEVAAQVLAGEVDLGFVEGPDLPAGLRAETVGTDALELVVAPDHPWARRRRKIRPDELAATPLISRERGSGTRRALELALAPEEPAGPLLELSSTTAIKSAVMEGIGPAVLGAHTVAAELAAGTLVAVEVAGLDLRRDLRLVWRSGHRLRGPAADLAAIAVRGA